MSSLALCSGRPRGRIAFMMRCAGSLRLATLVGLVALGLVLPIGPAAACPGPLSSAPLIVTINSSSLQLKLGGSGVYTANATGGDPPYSYLWYSKAPNGSLTRFGNGSAVLFRPVVDGIYTLNVSAKDIGGNRSGSSTIVSVTGFSPVSIRLTSATSGGSLVLFVSASGGTPPYRYAWSGGGLNPNLSRNASVTLPHLATGEYIVGVQVTDAAGYTNSTSVKVVVNEGSPNSFPYLYLAVGLAVGIVASLPVIWLRFRRAKNRPRHGSDSQN